MFYPSNYQLVYIENFDIKFFVALTKTKNRQQIKGRHKLRYIIHSSNSNHMHLGEKRLRAGKIGRWLGKYHS